MKSQRRMLEAWMQLKLHSPLSMFIFMKPDCYMFRVLLCLTSGEDNKDHL